MTRAAMRTSLFAAMTIGLVLVSGCGGRGATESTSTAPAIITSTLTPARTDTEVGGIMIPGLSGLATAAPALGSIAPTRTAVPTATPDAVSRAVSSVLQEQGVLQKSVLSLNYADWINLIISLLYVLICFLIATWLIRWLLPRLVRRTKTDLDDRLLQVSGNQLRWLAVCLILQLAVDRLAFVSSGLKTLIGDLIFFLSLFLFTTVLWRLINLLGEELEQAAIKAGRRDTAKSLIALTQWAMRFTVLVLVVAILLAHFAVNITGVALFLGIITLVVSLASRDILTDMVAGAMILIDRPFRVGDRLDLPSIGSWGDVVEIGMRSTKILSVDNRMVVVPNSQIGKAQVVNYSYPDPAYFDTTHVMVAYENDGEQVERLLAEAIRSVEGVQKDRQVITVLVELTETHMHFWACWWIASYRDRYVVHGQVNRAIVHKLKESGVIFPYRRGEVNVKVDGRAAPPVEDT